MPLTVLLISILFRRALTTNCSLAPHIGGVKSSPDVSGHRFGRQVSILFAPPPNTAYVNVSFGGLDNAMKKELILLFHVEMKHSESQENFSYHLPANHQLSAFVISLRVHHECTIPFLDLVITPRCNFSRKIFFITDQAKEFPYDIISYDIVNPKVSRLDNRFVLSTQIIECRTPDMTDFRYLISQSFPIFYRNSSIRVPAHAVSRINKTTAICVITYQVANETILANKTFTIAYEGSHIGSGIQMELVDLESTLGISWIPANKTHENRKRLHFRYTFRRNDLRDKKIAVHLGSRGNWSAGLTDTALFRVPIESSRNRQSWTSYTLPTHHLAYASLRHLTSVVNNSLQMLEVILEPSPLCQIPMVFHVVATNLSGHHQLVATDYFETRNLHSFRVIRRPFSQKGDVFFDIDFCSPQIGKGLPPIRWKLEGIQQNWTTLSSVSNQTLNEQALRLSFNFAVSLKCEVQNFTVSFGPDYSPYQLVIDEMLPTSYCTASVGFSVLIDKNNETSYSDVASIKRHEPFLLRLAAQFPKFFSSNANMQIGFPHQPKRTIKRDMFTVNGAVLQVNLKWLQKLDNCRDFAEKYEAKLYDGSQLMAETSMKVLPRFCQPRIKQFRIVNHSAYSRQIMINCQVDTLGVRQAYSFGIFDNGEVATKFSEILTPSGERMLLELQGTINFTSCENLRLRSLLCWYRYGDIETVMKPLRIDDRFCEEPLLYVFVWGYVLLPIIAVLYGMVAVRACCERQRKRRQESKQTLRQVAAAVDGKIHAFSVITR